MGKKKQKVPSNTIAQNKKARYDYFIEETYEAGRYCKAGKSKACGTVGPN